MTPRSIDAARSPSSSPPSSPPSAQEEDANFNPKAEKAAHNEDRPTNEPNQASLDGLERYLEGSQVC